MKVILDMRWALFILLMAFAFPCYSQEQPSQKGAKAHNPAASDQRGTQQSPLIVEIAPSPDADKIAEKQETQEAEKSKNDTLIANATAALAAITLFLAFYTARLWKATVELGRDAKNTSERQSREMQESIAVARQSADAAEQAIKATRDAYIASERPWVSVNATINSDLVRKDNGIEFAVLFTVKNYGNSPAIDVWVDYEVVALRIAQDQFGGVRERIEARRKIPGITSNGIQLFPSEEKTIRWINPLNSAEIEAARGSGVNRAGWLPSFYVVGAIFYKSPFGDEIYQTGFNYYVMDNVIPGGSDLPDFTGTFSASRISLVSQPYNKGTIT